MGGEILEDRKRRNGENLLLAHQAHGFVAELIGMIDGSDTGARGVSGARLAGGVHGHVLADSRRLRHRGFQLNFGVLVRR